MFQTFVGFLELVIEVFKVLFILFQVFGFVLILYRC